MSYAGPSRPSNPRGHISFRLIDAINGLVFEQEAGRAYTDASNKLFALVHQDARSTRLSIDKLITSAQSATDFQERYESELIIRKRAGEPYTLTSNQP